MSSDINIIADLHTHTISSGHAFSTLKENITVAKERGIKYLAVTDHLYYSSEKFSRLNEVSRLTNLQYLPKTDDMVIIPGVESNLNHFITKEEDLEHINDNCTWRLVGCHSWFLDIKNTIMEEIPLLYEEALHNNAMVKPTAFAHIERVFPQCKESEDTLKDIVDIAVKNDIFLEINESSIGRKRDLMLSWLTYAKERKAKFSLGTDSHYCDFVGDFKGTRELIEQIGISSRDILNCDEDWLKEFVSK